MEVKEVNMEAKLKGGLKRNVMFQVIQISQEKYLVHKTFIPVEKGLIAKPIVAVGCDYEDDNTIIENMIKHITKTQNKGN